MKDTYQIPVLNEVILRGGRPGGKTGWSAGRSHPVRRDGPDGRQAGLVRSGLPGRRAYRASLTIEAAILVPLILAVIFLLLQVVLYLHDMVRSSAWLHESAWELRWSQESGESLPAEAAPELAVLRCTSSSMEQSGRSCRAGAEFRVCLLPRFVTILFTGQPDALQRQVTERVMDTPAFLRIAGAVLEEVRE